MPVSANAAKLNKKSLSLNVGKTYTLKASGTKGKIKWSSDKKSIATVSSKGVVTGKKKGSAVITAKYGKKKLTCKVTVKQPVTSVKLNKKSATLEKGKTLTLKATVSPSNANNKGITWSSSNKKVATVSSKGVVKAVGKGTATITAKAKDGSKKKATCKITVGSTDKSTVITTAEELIQALESSTKGKTYTLGKDIDFNKYVDRDTGIFTPYTSPFAEFKGILDGKGHKILNLKRALLDTNSGTINNVVLENISFQGTFVHNNYGTIKNIMVNNLNSQFSIINTNYGTVENIIINSCNVNGLNKWVCPVVYRNEGTIRGCTVKGKLNCTDRFEGEAAAIARLNLGTIANCNNYATITASQYAAGICQENWGQITKCANYGSLKVTYGTTSGIADMMESGTISNCLNVGKVDYGMVGQGEIDFVVQNCVIIGETLKGIIKINAGGDILDCYYLSSIPEPKPEDCDGTVRIIPIDSSDLTNKAAYPTLDFSNDWMMGAQYPIPR